jgi:uncharacterized ion transporter superfamily protein YfcC
MRLRLRAPNVFVLLFVILVVVGGLTWVIPGGRFEREVIEVGIGEREIVRPGTFARLPPGEHTPQGPAAILQAPIKGFGAHDAWQVIGFVLLVGGAFGVLHRTGAILAAIAWVTARAGTVGRYAMIPLLMFTFSAGGAIFGMAEETIPFILVTVPLAVALGFDVITGIAIPFVGSQAGFAAAFLNPFTLGIAKGIAGLPMGDGQGYRILCWLLVTAILSAAVTWHAWRVARDRAASPTPELDREWAAEAESGDGGDGETPRLGAAHVAVLVGFVGCMVALALGAVLQGWYIFELAALFVFMAVLCGLLGRLSPGEIGDAFAQGAKDLAPAAVLIALARGILVVAEDGQIIDPILDATATALEGISPVIASQGMFLVQTAINFFVPSGSGQAALTMPVMAPLADLLRVDREAAVLAFQFGDGFTNMIIPTNPVLMGVLSMARLPYGTWFRWMIKLQLVLLVVGIMLLAVAPFHG